MGDNQLQPYIRIDCTPPISVTTRGISFPLAKVFGHIKYINYSSDFNIYSYYRVVLAMFQSRMHSCKYEFTRSETEDDSFIDCNFFVSCDLLAMIQYINSPIPNLIAVVLSCLGPLKGVHRFSPVYEKKIDSRGRIVPLPGHVRFHNLREVVVSLSDPATDVGVRKNFYEHNPIPGAIWQGAPDNPLLANADEIMPENYTINEDFFRDISRFNKLNVNLCSKFPKLFCTGRLDYKSKGGLGLLVSQMEAKLRFIDRHVGEDLETYYKRVKVCGSLSGRVRSFTKLKDQDLFTGACSLLGEVANMEEYRTSLSNCRLFFGYSYSVTPHLDYYHDKLER